MKKTIIYDEKGNIVLTLDSDNSDYRIKNIDVPDDKKISAIDIKNDTVILVDKEVDKSELEKTNDKVDELQAQLQEAMAALDAVINGGA